MRHGTWHDKMCRSFGERWAATNGKIGFDALAGGTGWLAEVGEARAGASTEMLLNGAGN